MRLAGLVDAVFQILNAGVDDSVPDAFYFQISAADFAVLFVLRHLLDVSTVSSERVKTFQRNVNGAVVRRAGRSHNADKSDGVVDVYRIAGIDPASRVERLARGNVQQPGSLVSGDSFLAAAECPSLAAVGRCE